MRFKIDWASLIVGILLCFTLYLRQFSKNKPPGSLYLEGRFNGRFFALPVWGAYTWTGLFSEFYGKCRDKGSKLNHVKVKTCRTSIFAAERP